jgi:hypothetical protein
VAPSATNPLRPARRRSAAAQLHLAADRLVMEGLLAESAALLARARPADAAGAAALLRLAGAPALVSWIRRLVDRAVAAGAVSPAARSDCKINALLTPLLRFAGELPGREDLAELGARAERLLAGELSPAGAAGAMELAVAYRRPALKARRGRRRGDACAASCSGAPGAGPASSGALAARARPCSAPLGGGAPGPRTWSPSMAPLRPP